MRNSALQPSPNPPPAVAVRGVHLDLKGLAPTPARLGQLLRLIAAAGYNLVLVEWEDMYPWTVDPRFARRGAYTAEHVRVFARTCEQLGLQIVPLIQCLGHMETFLAWPEYRRLRAAADHADTLNPLADGAAELVQRLIDDVLQLTPDVRYLHLGGDEAWHLAAHPDCRRYLAEHGKAALYLHHVEPLLDHVAAKGLRPILWHDMMHDWPDEALRRLGAKADLMVWGYGAPPDESHGHYRTAVIERFHAAGVPMWGATAYKGADGPSADVPWFDGRARNALGWVELVRRVTMKGIVATAWSRHSTHRLQNEPIDGALDLLLYVAVVLSDGAPPAGGIEACRARLHELGEGERFEACDAALNDLAAARREAWSYVQYLREQLALQLHDPSRCEGGNDRTYLRILENAACNAKRAADRLRAALAGAVDPAQIDEYVVARLAPIDAELRELTPLVAAYR